MGPVLSPLNEVVEEPMARASAAQLKQLLADEDPPA